jgi:ribonuclease VapC
VIAVDTSALMAIVLNEHEAEACIGVLEADERPLISAGTMAEALIVADRRGVGRQMAYLVDGLGFEVVPITRDAAHRIALAYQRWGKGAHPAGLNFGDCFSYVVATDHSCPLLYVGDDFAQTDVLSAL